MKLHRFADMLFFMVIIVALLGMTGAFAADASSIQVTLQRPAGTLKMGDTPAFTGTVINVEKQPMEGLIVYLSLVSLEPGNERPVDLEDWSAQKAVRIDQLSAGETNTQKWGMRLIQAGKFGVALTVVDPKENRPIVSDLVPFDIQPKPILASNRILPVAIGEPLLLSILLGVLSFSRNKIKLEFSGKKQSHHSGVD